MDHVGFTVPNLDQAVEFFTSVLGCDLLYRTHASFDSSGGDWMIRHYGVDARARLRTAMLRCGPVTNLELLTWDTPDIPVSLLQQPGAFAGHLAIYVDDLEQAAASLGALPGVKLLGRATVVTNEPNEGSEFLFVCLPWGMHLELVKWPALMPYCMDTPKRLFGPAPSWRESTKHE